MPPCPTTETAINIRVECGLCGTIYAERDLVTFGCMLQQLSAEEMIPLVASMADGERVRLLQWVAPAQGADEPAYRAVPAALDEFSGGDEPLSWDADGWDEFA